MLERQKFIPEPKELIAEQPIPADFQKVKAERDEEIKKALTGESGKLLVVVGPCSAHDSVATLEYVARLGKLNEKVKEKLVLIPRIYTSKPRSKGVGYKGMILQPNIEEETDILRGIRCVRALLLEAMNVSGLTAADEMLYPENAPYVEDLLSYHVVGARSAEDPLHRQVASGLDVPVGLKNPMSGNLSALLYSVYAAQNPQVFKYGNYQVKSTGNPFAHAILRGGVDAAGADVPNFQKETLIKFWGLYQESGLKNPAVIIDCNHSNSGKKHKLQMDIAREVMKNRLLNEGVNKLVKGFMIESFLEEGAESNGETFGKSITDPCLGWADTERLLFELAELV
ncbi:MAG: 3-deoxy-7-phosphoheptulonate synthase [Clostridia bacterium]|nr:3-deoxy-7-phosphoheptulonate synthase [Clostridia bacterium]